MMENQIIEQYFALNNKLKCANFYKADLHIHTPGSINDNYSINGKRYEDITKDELIEIAKDKKLYKPDIWEMFDELSFDKDELIAQLIIHEAFEIKKMGLIAVTDHNTIDWCSKIIKAANDYFRCHNTKGRKFAVLPGVEITCFSGTHIIALFDNIKYEEQWEYLNYEINGIENRELRKVTFTNKSEIDVISAIKKVGGIAYMPHIDTGDEKIDKILKPLSGSSKIQLLRDKNLSAIGFSNYEWHRTIKGQLENPKNMYYRKYPIAYLKDSDAHDLEDIGKQFMYIKMEKPNFDSLRFSLNDPSTRIRDNIAEIADIPYIKGLVVRDGYLSKKAGEYTCYPFCKDLNCVIGGKGTGKSTLINSINSCIKGDTPTKEFRDFMAEFESIFLYFYVNDVNYCIVCEPQYYRDSYTDEETDKYGVIFRNSKITKIENWLTLYKVDIKKGKCIKINKIKTEKILKHFYIDYFAQTEIMQIGRNQKEMGIFSDNIIKRTDKGDEYNRLMTNYRKKMNEMYELQIPFYNLAYFYSELKELDKELKNLEEKIFQIKNTTIIQLNSLLKGKVEFVFEVENVNQEALEILTENIRGVERNKYNMRKISRVITYLCIKYRPVDLILKLLQYSNEIYSEIVENKITNSMSEEEVENADITDVQIIELLQQACKKCIKDLLALRTWVSINIKFNVNSYDNPNSKKSKFMPIGILSYGQKAVAVLTIILQGLTELKINTPLIIDQPEDQLDNQFIYRHLIKNIRNLKNKRQLILVTHNANIPVAGDSESIICMQSKDDKGWIYKNGSIDNYKIQKEIIRILEGGNESLKLRVSKYNNLKAESDTV